MLYNFAFHYTGKTDGRHNEEECCYYYTSNFVFHFVFNFLIVVISVVIIIVVIIIVVVPILTFFIKGDGTRVFHLVSIYDNALTLVGKD